MSKQLLVFTCPINLGLYDVLWDVIGVYICMMGTVLCLLQMIIG